MAVILSNENIFFLLLKNAGFSEPEKEYKFHPRRKWRFDYAYPAIKLAIEVEGGVYSRGRHTRANGFIADIDKYNEAVRYGWRLIRVIPKHLCDFEFIELISDIINNVHSNYIKEEHNERRQVRGKKSRTA